MSKPKSMEYVLSGITPESQALCLWDGRSFRQADLDSMLAAAKRWPNRAAVERFIAKEKAAGSDWQYGILPVARKEGA